MSTESNFSHRLAERRKRLGMTFPALAERSGVSEPTVKRILGGRLDEAAFGHVAAVAAALGAPLGFEPTDPDEFRRAEACAKAELAARLVQGTSQLEAQGVDGTAYRAMVERSAQDLLAGPARRLWAS